MPMDSLWHADGCRGYGFPEFAWYFQEFTGYFSSLPYSITVKVNPLTLGNFSSELCGQIYKVDIPKETWLYADGCMGCGFPEFAGYFKEFSRYFSWLSMLTCQVITPQHPILKFFQKVNEMTNECNFLYWPDSSFHLSHQPHIYTLHHFYVLFFDLWRVLVSKKLCNT